jgi:hypothetical protein
MGWWLPLDSILLSREYPLERRMANRCLKKDDHVMKEYFRRVFLRRDYGSSQQCVQRGDFPYQMLFCHICNHLSNFSRNSQYCRHFCRQEAREAQPFREIRAAASTRSAAALAQKRREQASLLPLRQFATLPVQWLSGTLSYCCQTLFAPPFAQGAFRHAGIATDRQHIIFIGFENFQHQGFMIG